MSRSVIPAPVRGVQPRHRPRPAVPGLRGAALAGAAALALAGCSSGTTAGPIVSGTDIASAPRAGVKDGGTMRWAVDGVPATLNAYQADADEGSARIAGAVLPAMFRLDARGAPQRDADFLADASVVANEPKQVVSYKLNPKARWSDGRAVGADDFSAQWKALSGRNTAFWTARNAGYDRIADVGQGADAHEVKVTFATPYADWRSLFTPLYPKAVTGSPDAFNEGARSTLTAVAGPFKIKGVDRKAGAVTLVRNPLWWGERAKLDQLVLTAVPAAGRAAALTGGKLDVAELDPGALAAVRKAEDAKTLAVRRAPGAAYSQLALNGSTGPLADERVRRAVARAVDRQAIADAVLKPLGLPAKALGNHLVLGSQNGYADHSSALGSADADQVQALLAAAGWQHTAPQAAAGGKAGNPAEADAPVPADADAPAEAEASAPAPVKAAPAPAKPDAAAPAIGGTVVEPAGTLRKDGKQLSLRMVLPATSPVLADVGNRIATMLSKIGVRTEITKVADASFFHDHVAAGNFDLALYSWPGTAYPATDDRPIFAKPLPAPDGSLTVEQNYSRVGTDQIDQLLDRAGSELDQKAARDLAARADSRIWAAAGSIPLFQRPEIVALRPTVANVGAFGFESPRYQDIGFRK
ncbi:ABC transporter family substrate-binding protein [Streptomyces sp. SPB162]|uniref:ABC transporter family substrate-binding protein n=1 Tax=Streptomyces sp. SPB162 TaxID=2940560 RepID=UPI0024071524|nr:ABC transporter family substrate-binding protein [Streptomyces sp. SPB162]MDF9815403.1 peptide/nickel transport system substrate-binding protein [Streptomyces sp. SPB162]